jgi:hypothetical protein
MGIFRIGFKASLREDYPKPEDPPPPPPPPPPEKPPPPDEEGALLKEIALTGTRPTALAMGGEDGCLCLVAMADRGNLEGFRVECPGRAWQLLAQERGAPTSVQPASWGALKQAAQ